MTSSCLDCADHLQFFFVIYNSFVYLLNLCVCCKSDNRMDCFSGCLITEVENFNIESLIEDYKKELQDGVTMEKIKSFIKLKLNTSDSKDLVKLKTERFPYGEESYMRDEGNLQENLSREEENNKSNKDNKAIGLDKSELGKEDSSLGTEVIDESRTGKERGIISEEKEINTYSTHDTVPAKLTSESISVNLTLHHNEEAVGSVENLYNPTTISNQEQKEGKKAEERKKEEKENKEEKEGKGKTEQSEPQFEIKSDEDLYDLLLKMNDLNTTEEERIRREEEGDRKWQEFRMEARQKELKERMIGQGRLMTALKNESRENMPQAEGKRNKRNKKRNKQSRLNNGEKTPSNNDTKRGEKDKSQAKREESEVIVDLSFLNKSWI